MRSQSVVVQGETFNFFLDEEENIFLNGKKIEYSYTETSDSEINVIINGKSYSFLVDKEKGEFFYKNKPVDVHLITKKEQLLKSINNSASTASRKTEIKSPMPGLVVKIEKNIGDNVSVGDGLIILEAMKMENEIKSPTAGIVKKIFVIEKQTVEKNSHLMLIE